MVSITGEQMDVLDRLWDIFKSVEINFMALAYHAGFETLGDAEDHYNDIGMNPPSKIEITRRDLKTVIGLACILEGVKAVPQIDWNRVALRSGLRNGEIAKAHHRDLAMLEDPTRSVRLPVSDSGYDDDSD
ncbi:hypothetical protein PG984_006922 [Apiospora sp. TS-2023a]